MIPGPWRSKVCTFHLKILISDFLLGFSQNLPGSYPVAGKTDLCWIFFLAIFPHWTRDWQGRAKCGHLVKPHAACLFVCDCRCTSCASCSVFQAFCAFKAATNKRETELRGTQKVRCNQFCTSCFRQRPYSVENTRSHLNSEVKQPKARSVLGWGTAWEVLRVLLAFCFELLNSFWGVP